MKKNLNENRKFLINRLGYVRNRAKMSARCLSELLDKSVAYIAKFDNGDFEMPSETLLEAINLCGSTPEEFFSKDINNFAQNKEFLDIFENLSPESKQTIKELMKNMK